MEGRQIEHGGHELIPDAAVVRVGLIVRERVSADVVEDIGVSRNGPDLRPRAPTVGRDLDDAAVRLERRVAAIVEVVPVVEGEERIVVSDEADGLRLKRLGRDPGMLLDVPGMAPAVVPPALQSPEILAARIGRIVGPALRSAFHVVGKDGNTVPERRAELVPERDRPRLRRRPNACCDSRRGIGTVRIVVRQNLGGTLRGCRRRGGRRGKMEILEPDLEGEIAAARVRDMNGPVRGFPAQEARAQGSGCDVDVGSDQARSGQRHADFGLVGIIALEHEVPRKRYGTPRLERHDDLATRRRG